MSIADAKTPYTMTTRELLLSFGLAQLTPLHRLLPERVVHQLPVSWNLRMLSMFMRSKRRRFYADVCCELKMPESFAPKVGVVPEYRLSNDDIRFFYENGYSGPHTLCSPEEMEQKKGDLWRLFRAPSEIYPEGTYTNVASPVPTGGTELSNYEVGKAIVNARDKHLQDPSLLLAMVTHPSIRERVAQLLGPDLLIWRSQYFPKLPGHGGTAWHQATVYLGEAMRHATLTPRRLDELFQVTVWTAITDSTLENGCLRVIPGTHRQLYPLRAELYDPEKHRDNKTDRFGAYMLRPDADLSDERAVNIPMKAGQFLIFSERVLHASLPNTSAHDLRLGVASRYILPSTRVYNSYEIKGPGHDIGYLGISGLPLDKWRAMLVRGEDRHRVNGDRVVRFEPPAAAT
jgi:chlorinating enzyme